MIPLVRPSLRLAGLALGALPVLSGCYIEAPPPPPQPPPMLVVNDPSQQPPPPPVATAEAAPTVTTQPPPPPAERPKLSFQPAAINHDGSIALPGPVVFETASDKLRPESDEVLAVVEAYLKARPDVTLMRIEGHTDDQGNANDNQTLSERRAMTVARWLIGRGIACGRLIAVGFGGGKPIALNSTPDGRAQNRRTMFVNAALRGRPIGGMPVDGSGGHIAGDPCK